jgi:structural maintenance of chromosome 3 (chondroitin sulfate proteoglycan 6)
VVVDSDDTAQKVLNIMLREKIGRVTFMPLNHLKPKNLTFTQSTDAIPLLSKIEYDAEHKKAFQQVLERRRFARTLQQPQLTQGAMVLTLWDKVEQKGARCNDRRMI